MEPCHTEVFRGGRDLLHRPSLSADTSKVPGEDGAPPAGSRRDYTPSFEVVFARARAGEAEAFEQIFRALSGPVHHFARLRGAADPEGLVNDVLLKTFTNLARFDGGEVQFRAWVFTMARNLVIDEHRKRERRVQEVFDESASEQSATALVGDAENEGLGWLGNEWVAEQLALVTAEQREVVVLRIVGDLTIEAIAQVMGKRVGAVKALQRRAFRTIARNVRSEAAPL
ncbi:MAG: RNA polymerase sigma factor [Acidimicrobiales bacterium]